MKNLFARFVREDNGQDLIEYALLSALIGLGATVAMTNLKDDISDAFSKVGTKLVNSIP